MAESRGSSAPLKGIACMVAGGAFLTANDAVLKMLTGGYPVGQLMFLRGMFVMLPITYFVWRAGGLNALVIHSFRAHAMRAAVMIAGTYLFVSGLKYLPLADAISIAFAGPLFVTALAPVMLGERVGWRRWMAVLAGFVGILIIFRPGGSVFQWAALFPLAASCTGAMRDILTRKFSATETSEALLFYSTVGVALGGLLSLPVVDWQPVSGRDWGFLVLNGLLIGGAHYLMIETFRYAEAALASPFKYTTVIWATLLGYLMFGDVPEATTFIGGGVVVASGIFILHRERQQRRAAQKL
jgi:drug/metabolite transporter (DMT)-like permease